MSFFFNSFSSPVPRGVSFTLFLPLQSHQILLVKGKLGQVKLLSSFLPFDGSSRVFFKMVSPKRLLFVFDSKSQSFSDLVVHRSSSFSLGFLSPIFFRSGLAFYRLAFSSLFHHLHSFFYGVSQGFSVSLELKGLGFHASVLPSSVLSLRLGFSHPIFFPFSNVHISILGLSSSSPDSSITLTISGLSKSFVNQVAATIYSFKKPDPYKGKGFRYDGRFVLLKPVSC